MEHGKSIHGDALATMEFSLWLNTLPSGKSALGK